MNGNFPGLLPGTDGMLENYLPFGPFAAPDVHAHNVMVVLQALIHNFDNNLTDFVEEFIETVPWWWTHHLFDEAQTQTDTLTDYSVRLFIAPAAESRLQWGPELWEFPGAFSLLMTVDGPFQGKDSNMVVWGALAADLGFRPVADPHLRPIFINLIAVLDWHMHHVLDEEQNWGQWESKKGLDGWILGNPWEVVFETQVLPNPDDPVQEALAQEVSIEPCDENLSYVGLRPTGFDKPLPFQTTKGQAARAAREILRHIILHCDTNFSALVKVNDKWKAPGTKDEGQRHTFLTIAPDPYLSWQDLSWEQAVPNSAVDLLFQAADEFSQDLSSWESLYEVVSSGDCDDTTLLRKQICTSVLLPQGRPLTIPVIWPAGFDNQVIVHQGKDTDFSPGIYKPLRLKVSHYQELDEQEPPGQFFPVFNEFSTTPVGCILAYQLIVKYWLPFGSLQLDNYQEGKDDLVKGKLFGHFENEADMRAKWHHPKSGSIPNPDGTPGWDQSSNYSELAIERFALAEQTDWLWDSWLAPLPLPEQGQPNCNVPFVNDEDNNLWKRLNNIPDQYNNSLAWNQNGPERHQRLALTLVRTDNPFTATVVSNSGNAAVCLRFTVSGNWKYAYTSNNAGVPVCAPICGQEHSRFSPFAWPWRSPDTCALNYANLHWDNACNGPCYPNEESFVCAEVQGLFGADYWASDQTTIGLPVPAGWQGYEGFAFPPQELP